MIKKVFKIIFLTLFTIQFLNASFLETESKKAAKEKKLILLTIKSEFCPYCIKMKKDVFDVKQYTDKINKKYIHVEMDRDDSLLPNYLHVKYVPTNFILSPHKLEILDEFPGYIKPDHFLELLDEVYRQEVK